MKKRPKSGNKRAGVLFAVLAGLLITASIVVACTVFFRVETVSVEGNERYLDEQILAVANVEGGSNLVLTPAELIEQRILDDLPYIDEVKVRKRLPTTLQILVIETQPVAVVCSETGNWLIDSGGKLLEEADEILLLQYPNVQGLELEHPSAGQKAQVAPEYQKRLDALIRLLTALEERGMMGDMTAFTASSGTEITATYQNRILAKFLVNADFDRKVQIMQEIVVPLEEWSWGSLNLKGNDKAVYSPGG